MVLNADELKLEMKSQIFIKWFLSIFIISLITAVIISSIFPSFYQSIASFLSLASAEVVADQLSSLISVSSSAPTYIEITYYPTNRITYNVFSLNRRLIVYPNYNFPFMKNIWVERFYTVNLNNFEYYDVNKFLITKKRIAGNSTYSIDASKGEEY